ncbi:mannose-1-phosphate guanylyltransferase [Rhizobium sp. AN5]|uniref:mannose-1-phosphate guanylyltransferase n=1 Tax=Rhizobium sp. AN5 TaxID=1855304 RepID=UPI000BCDBC79|nr:sugar phosphate nucleotidyltransferase [Rhizobium sp. AN5]SOC90363.1 mannose-1-phosphate guanylyltransferase [Rhizobium sp. AN5]
MRQDLTAVAGENTRIVPAIMIGGSGTRLWPLSRSNKPKQFLTLGDDGHGSFFQQALGRFAVPGYSLPWLMCARDTLVHAEEQVASGGFSVDGLIVEPSMQGTAAAIAALTVTISRMDAAGSNAVLLVAPSDHIIAEPEIFNRIVAGALPIARFADRIVTFGIKPEHPETGFGYIRPGEAIEIDGEVRGYAISAGDFLEKPSLENARRYVEEGFCWNAGIFMFRAGVMLEELARHAPETLRAAEEAFERATIDMFDDIHAIMLESSAFRAAPADIPIDTAIMERTSRGAVVRCEGIGWSDIGSLSALHEIDRDKDANGNALSGPVLSIGSTNTLAYARGGRKVVLIGLEDMIVIDDDDAVLVTKMSLAQKVKDAVNLLKQNKMPESRATREQLYGWGKVRLLSDEGDLSVFTVTLRSNATIALRIPEGYWENWAVSSGKIDIILNGFVRHLVPMASLLPTEGEILSLYNGTARESTIVVTRQRSSGRNLAIAPQSFTADTVLDLIPVEADVSAFDLNMVPENTLDDEPHAAN